MATTTRKRDRQLAREITNTARRIGSMGPHRLIVGCGPRGANYVTMARGARAQVEALYRLAALVCSGRYAAEQVAPWL